MFLKGRLQTSTVGGRKDTEGRKNHKDYTHQQNLEAASSHHATSCDHRMDEPHLAAASNKYRENHWTKPSHWSAKHISMNKFPSRFFLEILKAVLFIVSHDIPAQRAQQDDSNHALVMTQQLSKQPGHGIGG